MKIYLSGYFHENLGDDLFFHIITQRYAKHQFYMMVHGDHAHAYRGRPNVKVHAQPKLLRGADKILSKVSPNLGLGSLYGRTKEISVLIGGSMFQELYKDGSDLKRLAQMPQNRSKLYILGINYGPAKTMAYRDAVSRYLASATDVCFRDRTSFELFQELPNARVGNDIVFGIRNICPAPAQKQNTCVISLIDFDAKPDLAPYKAAYLQFLRERILEQQALGREVILTSFCRWEGDEKAIRELKALCEPEVLEKLKTLCYDGHNWKELCNAFASASWVISTRFHAMVLGLVYQVPTVVISYSNKIRQLLRDMDRDNCAISPKNLANFPAEQICPVTDIDVKHWQNQAELHFEKLDALLRP